MFNSHKSWPFRRLRDIQGRYLIYEFDVPLDILGKVCTNEESKGAREFDIFRNTCCGCMTT